MLALTLLIGLAHGGRIVVDANGGGDHADLQSAVDAARPGDYLVVYAGEYTPFTLYTWAGPIIGLDGPELTWIDGGGAMAINLDTEGAVRLEGLSVQDSSYAVYKATAGALTLRRVHTHGSGYGVYVNGEVALDAQALVVQDSTYYGLHLANTSSAATLSGLTLVGADSGVYLYNATAALTEVISYGAPTVSGCVGTSMATLDYALIDGVSGSPYGSCVSASSVAIGVDPDFIDFTDDGLLNDDLELAASSPAVDAGAPSCLEPDGTACDLGGLAGPVGDQIDDDGDGLPESWELAWGTDPSLDDGALDDDGDNLDNLGEYLFGTDPFDADSDGDGVDDFRELQLRADPLDPDDQRPSAALSVPSVGFVGEPLPLDGSGSSDPGGDPLRYTWTFISLPSDSALSDGDLPLGPRGGFTPDVPGIYRLQLSVDDGYGADAIEHELQVISSRTVRVPQDFESWAALDGLLVEGMEVVFDAGTYAIDVNVPSGITLRGQGMDETFLEHSSGQPALRLDDGGELRLRDLTLTSQSSYGLYVLNSSWIDLQGVRLDQPYGIAAYVANASVLTGVDLEVRGQQGLYNSDAVLHVGRSEVRATQGNALIDSYGAVSHLTGALLHGSVSLTRSEDVALSFLSVFTTDSGLVVTSAFGARVDHALFSRTSQTAYCNNSNALLMDHVVSALTSISVSGCARPLVWANEAITPDDDGVLPDGSAAIDGGDWRQQDLDGSRADIGATGGPFGLYTEEPLADPEADLDGDGITAVIERLLGTDDQRLDSDRDGVPDVAELRAGDDPADPDDHMPALRFPSARTQVGVDLTGILPEIDADPDGDACDFSWADGFEGPRTVFADAPGAQRLPWRLTCGGGQRSGELLVLVEEEIAVPGDLSLSEALSAAEDHHVLRLAEGVYADPIDLRGKATALVGAGPGTQLFNTLRLDHPDAWISDLAVHDEDLFMQGGQAQRVDVVNATAWMADVEARNLLAVGGDLQLRGAGTDLAMVTADGDIALSDGDLLCAAATGELRVGLSDPAYTVDGASGFDSSYHFIHYDDEVAVEDPILDPWPGSMLWDACGAGGLDLDGGVADMGHTGGPLARPVDVDGDAMNDRWEAWRGVDDPSLDPDEDGLSNLEEFGENTDPLDNDTDGDRLPDGEDARPLTPDTAGVVARIDVDRFPVMGQLVVAGAGRSDDPAGMAFTYDWALEPPLGSEATAQVDGNRVSFHPDVRGPYDLTLTVTTEDGEQSSDTAKVWLGAIRIVPRGASPQPVIDDANPGDRVVLEEGIYRDNLRVDKDLVIAHAQGAMDGRLDSPSGAPALSVEDGAVVRVEALTLRGEDSQPGVLVYDGELELRQARVIGGVSSVQVLQGFVDLRACALLGAYNVMELSQGRAEITNCVLGYGLGGVPFSLYAAELELVASVLDVGGGVARPVTGSGWTARFDHVLMQSSSENLVGIETDHVSFADARFLLGPDAAESWLDADLRLSPSSPGVDGGPPGRKDFDGTRADIGAMGGAWGDWPGVDNDRDGFTNLEGDCDDADPEAWPDPYTGVCGDEGACGGCDGGGSSAFSLWVLLAFLGRRRSSAAS